MRDARRPEGQWVKDAQVWVEGDRGATGDPATWTTMAVLEVHPRNIPFLIGWRSPSAGATTEFYSQQVEPYNAQLAMGVGDGDVWFVARPVDGTTQLIIELVELTTEDDPKYEDTPRY